MKKTWMLLFALCFYETTYAQKILSLKPFIGRQTPLCRFDKSASIPADVTIKPSQMTWSPGVWLTLKLNSGWAVQTGIEMGWTGWHLKNKKSEKSSSDDQEGFRAFHQTNQLQF